MHVNHGFWYHLDLHVDCAGWNPTIFGCHGILRVTRKLVQTIKKMTVSIKEVNCKLLKDEPSLSHTWIKVSSKKFWGSGGHCGGFNFLRCLSIVYTLFQNGRHFNILLFIRKLALVPSFKGQYSFDWSDKANLQEDKRILKWQPFWSKVYKATLDFTIIESSRGEGDQTKRPSTRGYRVPIKFW